LAQEFVSEDVYQALKLDAAAAVAAPAGGRGGGVLERVGLACKVMVEGEEGVGEGVEEEDEKLKAREEEEEEDSAEYLTYIKFAEHVLERKTAGVGALIES
jgi:hypothetical protein